MVGKPQQPANASHPAHPSTDAANTIEQSAPQVIRAAIDQFYALRPDLREQHGPKGIAHSQEDCAYHLQFLVAALRANDPSMFVEYIRWAATGLHARNSTRHELALMLETIAQQARRITGHKVWSETQPILDAALLALRDEVDGHALYTMPPEHVLTAQYVTAILRGDRLTAQSLIFDAHNAGLPLTDVYLQVLQPALYEIGRRWERGLISVAHEHLATAITQSVLATVYANQPLSFHRDEKVIVACLKDNHHQIGPRMVADFLSLEGYNTLFLGADTPLDGLLALIDEIKPSIVGLPASMAAHVEPLRQAIDQIRHHFTSNQPTVLVGGIMFNRVDSLWKQVGGDVWGPDAQSVVRNLLGD